MVTKAIPRLRFKGFTSIWNLKELKNIFKRITNAYVGTVKKYYTNSFRGHFYLESNNIKHGRINVTNQVFVDDKFYRSQKKNWLHTNDIVMVQSGAVGDTAVIPKNLNNTAAHAVIVLSRPKLPTDSYFLNDEFQSQYFKREIYKLAIGNTISHVLASDIKKSLIKIPSLSEQQQIDKFFAILDQLIHLQQKKVTLLKKLKKAYLQKLFPHIEETTTPRIRFKGFYDKWNIKLLKNLCHRCDNLREPVSSSKRIKGNINYYGANGVEDHVKGYTCNGKYILIAEDGANSVTDYPIYETNGKFWVNNHAHVLSTKSHVSISFLKYALTQVNMRTYLVGGGRLKLRSKELMSIKLLLPSLDEQICIGEFLNLLDKHLNYINNYIIQIINLKKAYLQKMFC